MSGDILAGIVRYIGGKERLLPFIEQTIRAHGVTGGTFVDLFAGTTAVGRHFKRLGFRVVSNDLMRYSYVLGKAYIENSDVPQFAGLDICGSVSQLSMLADNTRRLREVLAHLNAMEPVAGYVYSTYSYDGTKDTDTVRMFFTGVNAGRIDAIRTQIEAWHGDGRITESEYYVLLASLIEAVPSVSNTSGTYAAFLKFWESRNQKPLTLDVPAVGGHAGRRKLCFACDTALTG